MVLVARNQDPWVIPLLGGGQESLALVEHALRQRFRDHALDECLVLAGGDHGYWREERLCRRGDRWLVDIDSHRGVLKPEVGRLSVATSADLGRLRATRPPSPLITRPLSHQHHLQINNFRGTLRAWLRLPADEHGLIRPNVDCAPSVVVWREDGDKVRVFAIPSLQEQLFSSIVAIAEDGAD